MSCLYFEDLRVSAYLYMMDMFIYLGICCKYVCIYICFGRFLTPCSVRFSAMLLGFLIPDISIF